MGPRHLQTANSGNTTRKNARKEESVVLGCTYTAPYSREGFIVHCAATGQDLGVRGGEEGEKIPTDLTK